MIRQSIAIVYHSGYGHTGRQAEAVRAGVEEVDGAEPMLLTVDAVERHWSDLNAAHAIIFGSPTYMGAVSAPFKTFQEATSKTVLAKGYLWRDKIAAGFTTSESRSGDKLSTLMQMVIFAAQHGMHWVGLDLPPANCSSTGSEEDMNRLGFWLGAAAQANTDEGPETAPPPSDLATARHLGRRVALTALQFARGREVNPFAREFAANE
ncbi:multimeric flavodoxin WrbA [Rhizobium sp. ERR 922]|uniref:flavodoxin family protein n=1 Tax=unclassified Rhizobium TaxID=2613769 RepID=UPI0011A8878A|nr:MULTISPECIES: flavodoxin family protein [unclassified Rhizobium]TWB62052.1 multimeric flavodoxin WrbA [Rhizobium sp. ERR 922]TWC04978.1 multimeric flavodoxin WrbA [Rhizobium sp. ERR 942]